MTPRLTRAQRLAMPLARDVVRELAISHGGCIRPVQLRRTHPDTGQAEQGLVPCGHPPPPPGAPPPPSAPPAAPAPRARRAVPPPRPPPPPPGPPPPARGGRGGGGGATPRR